MTEIAPAPSGAIVLAIDVGLKAGLAWFTAEGELIRARSTRFPNRTVLKKALPAIWTEQQGVMQVVLEGQGEIADIFRKSAERASIPVQQFSAEQWREDMARQVIVGAIAAKNEADPTNVIHLITEYNTETNQGTPLTYADIVADKTFWRWVRARRPRSFRSIRSAF